MLFHVLGYADDLGFAIEWDMVIFTAHNRIPPFQYSFCCTTAIQRLQVSLFNVGPTIFYGDII